MYADWPLLSLVIWTPILGGILVLFTGDKEPAGARKIALLVSIVTFLLTLPLYTQFNTDTHLMQFVERQPWIDAFNIEYSFCAHFSPSSLYSKPTIPKNLSLLING